MGCSLMKHSFFLGLCLDTTILFPTLTHCYECIYVYVPVCMQNWALGSDTSTSHRGH